MWAAGSALTVKREDAATPGPVECESVSDETIERVVLRLNAICRRTTVEFAVTVGRVIVDEFYGGVVMRLRARGEKSCSFRKLAKHPRLPMSPVSLYRSVAIFELCERLGIEQWKHVSTTHMRLVVNLPAEEQRRLLEAAEAHVWSARRLEHEVAELRVRSARRGGPPRLPRLKKTIRALEKCLDERCGLVGADDASIRPSPESARAIVEVLRNVKEACAAVEERITRSCAHTKD